jgi:hypothetical protein
MQTHPERVDSFIETDTPAHTTPLSASTAGGERGMVAEIMATKLSTLSGWLFKTIISSISCNKRKITYKEVKYAKSRKSTIYFLSWERVGVRERGQTVKVTLAWKNARGNSGPQRSFKTAVVP